MDKKFDLLTLGEIMLRLSPQNNERIAKCKIFENNGIITINDLMSYYPFRYDLIKRSNISELEQDDKIIIDGIVENDNAYR